MPHNKLSVIEAILFALFAGVGGILSYLMRSFTQGFTPALSRALVESLSSAFVGVIAMLICKAMDIDIYWSGAVVGLFGWLGAETSMVLFTKLVKSRLGLGEKCNNPKK